MSYLTNVGGDSRRRASSESRSASVSVSDAVAISSSGVPVGSGGACEAGNADRVFFLRPRLEGDELRELLQQRVLDLLRIAGQDLPPVLADLHDAAPRLLDQPCLLQVRLRPVDAAGEK